MSPIFYLCTGKPNGELCLLEAGDLGSTPKLCTMDGDEFKIESINPLRYIILSDEDLTISIKIKVGKGINAKSTYVRSSKDGIKLLIDEIKYKEIGSPVLNAKYERQLFTNHFIEYKFLANNKFNVSIVNNNNRESVTMNEDQWDNLIKTLEFILV